MQLGFFERTVSANSFSIISGLLSSRDKLTPDEFGNSIRAWAENHAGTPVKTLALFSGAGGLDIGFNDAGFDVVEAVEIEPKFAATLSANKAVGKYLSHTHIVCQDIREYNPDFGFPIDFVIGGPPCQSFSAAGRRAAGVAGTKDERGGLFEEYVRILEKLRPKGFLFENVYGLMGAEGGDAIRKISQAFKEVGYHVSYRILDAADYGVPQHRERLIIVGAKDFHFKFPKPTHGPDSSGVPYFGAYDALQGLGVPDERLPSINGRFGHLLKEVPPGLNYSFFTEKMGHPEPIFAWRSKFSDFLYKADPSTPIRTLKASGGQYTGPFHWENRHFTIGELKRLQTFPDDYTITGNRATAARQIGNSVPPQFARMLALSVLNQFFGVALPFPLHCLDEAEPLSFRKTKAQKTHAYKAKAQTATYEKTPADSIPVLPSVFKATLQKNFRYSKQDSADGFTVFFQPEQTAWTVAVSVRDAAGAAYEPAYQIRLRKVGGLPLFENVKTVLLKADAFDAQAYILLWKAFEHELAHHKIKADLVQLNGYYQYPANVIVDFTACRALSEDNRLWQVLADVFTDDAIGRILTLKSLADKYNLPENQLADVFKQMRTMGYEIRNSNTNPEIPAGSYLIPYRFPTLTPLSVQLKRALKEPYEY